MSEAIFATHAPAYYAKGLSAIPVLKGTKKPHPTIKNWSGYCDNVPKVETQLQWIEQFSDAGIGICTGREVVRGYRLAAIDLDDDDWRNVIRATVSLPRISKRGKKGETHFVLAEKALKSTSMRDYKGRQVLDLLIGGRQSVIPPTIHPETGQPYRWTSGSLLDVEIESLPIFSERNFRVLKSLIASEEACELLADGGSDADA